MGTLVTTRAGQAGAVHVLDRLAERWRPTGLNLACLKPDGTVTWQDAQMPRLLTLCLGAASDLVTRLRSTPADPSPLLASPMPGVELHLLPILRRRKTTGWIAVLARTGPLAPGEDVQRAAGRASLDLQALLAAAERLPALASRQVPLLLELVRHMHDDLLAAGVAQHELSSVTEQLSSVYEEISLLYKISSQTRVSRKPQDFLETVCREMQAIGNFHALAVAYARREDDSALPIVGEMAVQVGDCALHGQELINALHAPLMESLRLGEAQVRNDLSGASDSQRLRSIMERFVCVPLMREKRPLGILLAIDKNDGSHFNSVDLKLLSNVASQCSIFLENAALYQDMEGLFMGVLHALTRSIDAKDTYTRGHSQRVAELSRNLARRIGLPDAQCERIYLSGLLHDVGKIGVPEAVLTKPGRLSDAEFEAIKKHPAIGAQILGNIKQLQDVIPGVLYHHERWDGRGYPYNLSGEAIPLMGRIICVADSFDAMSSTRTYRPALPLDTTLAEIQRCAGAQFDPTLAKIFITMDFTPYRQAVEEQLSASRQIGFNGAVL